MLNGAQPRLLVRKLKPGSMMSELVHCALVSDNESPANASTNENRVMRFMINLPFSHTTDWSSKKSIEFTQ